MAGISMNKGMKTLWPPLIPNASGSIQHVEVYLYFLKPKNGKSLHTRKKNDIKCDYVFILYSYY